MNLISKTLQNVEWCIFSGSPSYRNEYEEVSKKNDLRNKIDGLRARIHAISWFIYEFQNGQKQRLNWIVYYRFIFYRTQKYFLEVEIQPSKVSKGSISWNSIDL